MKLVKNVLLPVIIGVLAFIILIGSLILIYWLLLKLCNFPFLTPFLRFILPLDVSWFGVSLAYALLIGLTTTFAMNFIDFVIKGDDWEKRFAWACRTCGVLFTLLFIYSLVTDITTKELSWSLFAGHIPQVFVAAVLLRGKHLA